MKRTLTLLFMLISALASGCVPCSVPNYRADTNYFVIYAYPPAVLRNQGRNYVRVTSDSQGVVSYGFNGNGGCDNVRIELAGGSLAFNAFPKFINLQAPPGAFQVQGEGMSTNYGMPVVRFYQDSTPVGEMYANSVSPDGTLMDVSTPDLSGAYDGKYIMYVGNREGDGSLSQIGAATVEASGRPTDADGDGHKSYGAGGGDCNDSNPNIHPGSISCDDKWNSDNNCNGIMDYEDSHCSYGY